MTSSASPEVAARSLRYLDHASARAADATTDDGPGPHVPPPTERASSAHCTRRNAAAALRWGAKGSPSASVERPRRAVRRDVPRLAWPPARASVLPRANLPAWPRSLGLLGRASAGTPAGNSSAGITSMRGTPAPRPWPLRRVIAGRLVLV